MKQPEKYIEDEIRFRQAELAEKIVDLQYQQNPGYWKKYGEEGRRISIRDAAYHLPFLTEAIVAGDPDIFNSYVLWVKQLFRNLGFSDSVMTETLECIRVVLKETFGQEYHHFFDRFIDSGLETMEQPLMEQPGYLDIRSRNGQLAIDYTHALLRGDRHSASQFVMKAVEEGVPVKEIYLDIFQNSQYEIGRLWLDNQISVATEHFCTAATQSIMAQLYPYIFTTERFGRRLVAACVGGELHELGIRMVSDFFEMDGWDTYYLGANSPATSIMKAIDEYQADLVALSVSMPFHRSLLRETIKKLRESTSGKQVKIMIGGHALNNFRDNWAAFNADGYAPNANEAVITANKLITAYQ